MTKKIYSLALVLFLISCAKNNSNNPSNSNEIIQEEFVPENGGSSNGVGFCQCVAYIKHQLGISSSTANAKDWFKTYTPSGWDFVSGIPNTEDIVVIEPAFGGVDKTYGHIGLVSSISNINENNFTIVVQGANQGSTFNFTECNCNNVNKNLSYNVTSSNRQYIRFYTKTTGAINCAFCNDLILKNGPVVAYSAGEPCLGEYSPYAEGGVPPYEYSMNNSNWQSSNTFIICTSGTSVFKVKDSKGCTSEFSKTF